MLRFARAFDIVAGSIMVRYSLRLVLQMPTKIISAHTMVRCELPFEHTACDRAGSAQKWSDRNTVGAQAARSGLIEVTKFVNLVILFPLTILVLYGNCYDCARLKVLC